MNRDEMIKQLGEAGYDIELLNDVPDELLSEILRIHSASGDGGGEGEGGEGEGGAGGGEEEPTEEEFMEMTDEEKQAKIDEAEEMMERGKKMMERYGGSQYMESGPDVDPSEHMLAGQENSQEYYDYAMQPGTGVVNQGNNSNVQGPQPSPRAMIYSEIKKAVKECIQEETGNNIRRLESFAEQQLADQKKLAVDAFVEAKIKEGKIIPAEKGTIRHRLMRADSKTVISKFKEAGKEVRATELDLQMREIAKRPAFRFGDPLKVGEGGILNQFSEDEEEAKIAGHFEQYSEQFKRINPDETKDSFVKTFKQARRRDNTLTADKYLQAG